MNDAFRALADPTRRDILRLLRNGPQSSGEIAEHFTTAWPTISRHLGVLREAGLVLAERNGQQIVYELNTTVVEEVLQHLLAWLGPTTAPGGPHA
ncbi:MAG: autorepressor SdpR family transcription factor [Gemmatimonadota bacterium]|nr:autorepressor SdpR family transcription factor [Gemmatimonadota bacterium]